MNWVEHIDGYCERTGPEFWSEPINFVTNAAFVIMAIFMWYRCRDDRSARFFCFVLALIGIGSALFHSYAVVWAAVADVVPILMFVLIYIYFANRDFWNLSRAWAFVGVLLFFPFVALTLPLFQSIPILNLSAEYLPIALLITLYAVAFRKYDKSLSRGLSLGAVILFISIMFRSVDVPLCERIPFGTHFMWHILNSLMLAWMIEVLRRYRIKTQLQNSL